MAFDVLQFRCFAIPHSHWNEKVSSQSSLRVVSKSRKDEKLNGVLNSATFLAGFSLLGAAAAAAITGDRRAFACNPPVVNSTTISTSSQTMDNTPAGSGAEMNEDMRKEFEHWKTVPYALTVPFRVVGLRGSVPPVWIKDFMQLQGRRMRLSSEFQGSLEAIYKQLYSAKRTGEVSNRSAMSADVVTVGDSWLGAAISRGLIVPVGKSQELDWFQQLDRKLQAILLRDSKGRLSESGDVWGAPYRCGCMVIAYRKDKLKKAGLSGIQDWEDLWRPELKGRIAMIDSTREVLGVVLKSLGASLNAKNFENEVSGGREAVQSRFQEFRKQIRVFDKVNYLKSLGAGDVWVAVGWSNDVLPFAKRTSNVGVVAPASGTSLWADVWAVPATTSIRSDKVGGRVRGPSPLVSQWLEYCLQPARTLALQHDAGASPLNFGDGEQEEAHVTGPQLDTNLVSGLPPKQILDKSEFLQPLDEETILQYKLVLEV